MNATDNATYFSKSTSIYPGEYKPLPWQEKELGDKVKSLGPNLVKPLVDTQELPYRYRIEMRAPGFRREDFFINTRDHLLSITAVNKEPIKGDIGYSPTNCFDYNCINHVMVLPMDVDTDFAAAEYSGIILSISLFKSYDADHSQPRRIIVY